MARTALSRLLSFLLLLSASASLVHHISSAVSNRSCTAHFTAAASGLDAPQILPVNSSAFNWSYFDIVSIEPGSPASFVVIFYTSTATAFPLFLSDSGTVTLVQIALFFPNGTVVEAVVPADGATVTADGNVSSGDWHNSGFSWTHTGDSIYTVFVDAQDIGVMDEIKFQSIAQAHYPCGPAVAGHTMEVGPNVGWSNAIPDAAAAVELTMGGTKAWATTPRCVISGPRVWIQALTNKIAELERPANVASWYWGHRRLVPQRVRVGVRRDHRCQLRAHQRSRTADRLRRDLPAAAQHRKPSGYRITLDLAQAGTLDLNVSVTGLLIDNAEFTRVVGNITGVWYPLETRNQRLVILRLIKPGERM
ncbi:hypothetical protein FB451DRAFT_1189031 [Mycena latifolia]|nr:hypothetical protein FB451DRAFT_1189031 [Mycena latifolia]